MGQLAEVQTFIDLSARVSTAQALSLLMEQVTKEMGFDYFALIHHVDIRVKDVDTALWLENYPRQWAEVFVNTGLYVDDPMLVASHLTNVGFAWSEVPSMIKLTKKHKDILLRVRREGLGDGFTVPAHVPGEANGSCNFAMAGSTLIPRENTPNGPTCRKLRVPSRTQAGHAQGERPRACQAETDDPSDRMCRSRGSREIGQGDRSTSWS